MRGFIPGDSDSHYTLFTNDNGDKDGSFISFMKTTSLGLNFGIYNRKITNKDNPLNRMNSFDACLQGKDS